MCYGILFPAMTHECSKLTKACRELFGSKAILFSPGTPIKSGKNV